MKGILDQQATLNKQMAQQQQTINQQILAQNSKFEQMLVQIKELGSKSGKTPSSADKDEASGFMDESGMFKKTREEDHTVRPPIAFNSKIEFPQFNGSNPR